MVSTGSITPNFHEGTRSEYLAQYIFSAFGTSILVPHPEDSGVDLYCTLGERIGQRLYVENFYFAQVKSVKDEIVYSDNKSVLWLLSHNYPLLICYINKKEHLIEIYQTLNIASYFSRRENIESICLIPETEENQFVVAPPNEKNIRIFLGKPILKFTLEDLKDGDWIKKAKLVLKKWIELVPSHTEIEG